MSTGGRLLIGWCVLASCAIAWLMSRAPETAHTADFGLGPAVSPAWGFFPVDPRIERACECEAWPIPGGYCYSPWHGTRLVTIDPDVGTPD